MSEKKKNPHAVAMGAIGGKARVKKGFGSLTAKEKRANALRANEARWGKKATKKKRAQKKRAPAKAKRVKPGTPLEPS